MLGIRESAIYGNASYGALVNFITTVSKELGIRANVFQSNEEGKIVTRIQNAHGLYDGIIINAGAYTHTSIAILDALRAVALPTVEVHLSDIYNREDYRKVNFIKEAAVASFIGLGFEGYKLALEYFAADKADDKDK